MGWLILGAILWLAWAGLAWRLWSLAVRDDAASALIMLLCRVYARLVHRLRIEGRENIPPRHGPGTMIVVCNHTAGVDPVLVQATCPFEITWMMAEDMRVRWAEPFWRYAGILFVDRKAGQKMAARQALRLLEEGGVIGMFPEGRIERPAQRILPFLHGVGLLAMRMKAPVLPIIIDGTPDTKDAWESLWTRSRARVRVMPLIRYDKTELKAAQITDDLRNRFARWTGWPLAEDEAGSESE
jgi:1-acyl-sn-glycerol-3-phosphate acyltransferase